MKVRVKSTARGRPLHGEGGLDEVSICGPTQVAELRGGTVNSYVIAPEDFGLQHCSLEEIRGGDPEECAEILRGILKGGTGPKRDVVLLNSGAALYASGTAKSIADGIKRAQDAIDSGKAGEKLDLLIKVSNSS